MNQYCKRVVICQGVNCNVGERAEPFYKALQAHADELNAAHDAAGKWDQPRPLMVRTANCLDMCEHGPNLIIHPDKQVINELDQEKLATLIAELDAEFAPEAEPVP